MDLWNTNISVKTSDFCGTMFDIFSKFLEDGKFTDCTLKVEGQSLEVHKIILSASSSYFRTVFEDLPSKHAVICLKDISFENLKKVIYYMYHGETSIRYSDITSFVETAGQLKVDSLLESNISSKPLLLNEQMKSVSVNYNRPAYPINQENNKATEDERSSCSSSSSVRGSTKLKSGVVRKRRRLDISLTENKQKLTRKTLAQRKNTQSMNTKMYRVKPAPLSKKKHILVKIGTKHSLAKYDEDNNIMNVQNICDDEQNVKTKLTLAEKDICTENYDEKGNDLRINSAPSNLILMSPSLHLKDLNSDSDELFKDSTKSSCKSDLNDSKLSLKSSRNTTKKSLLSLKRRTMGIKPSTTINHNLTLGSG